MLFLTAFLLILSLIPEIIAAISRNIARASKFPPANLYLPLKISEKKVNRIMLNRGNLSLLDITDSIPAHKMRNIVNIPAAAVFGP